MSKRFLPLGLSWVLMLILAGGIWAAPPAQEPPPPRPLGMELEQLPFLDTGPAEPPAPEGLAAPLTDVAWSKIAFQSYRDGNWEIYLIDEHDYLTRLTHDGASDIHPRLNRGCTRIAFASNRQGNYEIYTMNLDGTGLIRLTANDANDGQPFWSPDGTRIAFQSYRDGQSEIYVMNADGSGQTRLTWDAGYDGEPAWSPDGNRIAFTSDRGGGYQIWVMNADGSGQQPLSTQPSSENPAWSPDGSQIAYDANGDADRWQEVWLMNADGSHQHQIYDLNMELTDAWVRSWSPDGRYVAFTRISFTYYQGNWYWTQARLYALDTFHGNITLLKDDNTAWRPDWQTTDGEAPTSSVAPLSAQSPGPFTVSWSGFDTGPSGFKNYDVQVREGAGGVWTDWWVETTETSDSYPGVGGHTYYFRSRARDNAGNVEPWPADADAWTTVEAIPPHTAVSPLPAYFRNGQILHWGGGDPGGSGIQRYDVQYKDTAGGGWTDWHTGTLITSDSFLGTVGHTYHFRCRAMDRAQNVESWPPGNGDTTATLYTWGVSGHVRDNADAPVTGAAVTTVPGAFHTIASGLDGAYAAYVLDEVPGYTVAWDKVGYGSLPSTEFDAWQDAQVEVILPPADNGVLNGGFESGNLGLGDWLPGGEILPVVTDTLPHTGRYAALLGLWSPEFAPPLNIPNTPLLQDTEPQIAIDATRGVHVVWASDAGLYYAHRNQDGIWSSPEEISYGHGATILPRLAVDGNGTVHVAWSEDITGSNGWEVCYTQRTTNGVWSSPEILSNGPGSGWLHNMAVDRTGVAHLIWHEPASFYARRSLDGHWSDPVQFAPGYDPKEEQLVAEENGVVHAVFSHDYNILYYLQSPGDGTWSAPYLITPNGHSVRQPYLIIAPDGSLHCVWKEFSESYGYHQLFYAHTEGDGTWSTPQRLSNSPHYDKYGSQLAADRTGVLHAMWYTYDYSNGGQSIYYAWRGIEGTWSEPEAIFLSPLYGVEDPKLAVDRQGTVHVAWPGADKVYYARKASGGAWTKPQAISDDLDGSWVQLAVDDNGYGHIVWAAESDIYYVYAGPSFARQTGDSYIAQAVSVPVTPSTPVLSFLYQLGGTSAANNTWFSVQVDNGLSATTLFSSTDNTGGWTHRWFDMSPWASQTVTLTFNVHETAGRPVAWAYLDEVTVGPAYPDLWVHKNPVAALPGQQAILTLAYGNRGGAAAHGVRITDTLPAELTFIAASPPPLTTTPALVWEAGDLAAKSNSFTLVVTATVDPTAPLWSSFTNIASIGATSPELETANNQASAIVFVGRRTYLPLVFKVW